MCDAEHSYLSSSVVEDEYDPMHQLHESSVTYRIGIMLEKLPMQLKKITGITLNPWPILLDHYISVIALVCVRDGANKGNRPLHKGGGEKLRSPPGEGLRLVPKPETWRCELHFGAWMMIRYYGQWTPIVTTTL